MRKAAMFIGLTFLVNWSFALLFYVLGGRWGTPVGIAFGAAYMFVPMIVAIVLQKGVYREPLREPLGISFRLNRWFLVAWWLPPVIAFATFGVSLLLPGVEYSPQMQGIFERFASLLTPEQMQQLKERMGGTPLGTIGLVLFGGLLAGITINATYGLSIVLVRGGSDLTTGVTGLPGFLVLAVVILILWGHDPNPARNDVLSSDNGAASTIQGETAGCR